MYCKHKDRHDMNSLSPIKPKLEEKLRMWVDMALTPQAATTLSKSAPIKEEAAAYRSLQNSKSNKQRGKVSLAQICKYWHWHWGPGYTYGVLDNQPIWEAISSKVSDRNWNLASTK